MGISLCEPWRSPDGLQQLRAWRQQGLTCRETAAKAGVAMCTLQRWTKQYPEIRDALDGNISPEAATGTPAPAGNSTTAPAAGSSTAPSTSSLPTTANTAAAESSAPVANPIATADKQPAGSADLYTLARDAGLLPLSPNADPHQLEKLVESALLRRALGYRYTTITTELRKDPVTGENAMVITKRIDKDVPPDTSAQLFWLKCRASERWRDKPGDEPDGDDQVIVTFDVDEEEDAEEGGWEEE